MPYVYAKEGLTLAELIGDFKQALGRAAYRAHGNKCAGVLVEHILQTDLYTVSVAQLKNLLEEF